MVMRRLTFNLFQVSSLHVTYGRSYANLSIARTPDLIYNVKTAKKQRGQIDGLYTTCLNTIEMECDVQYIF